METTANHIEALVLRTLLNSRVPVALFSWRNEEGWPVEFVSPNVEYVLGYTAEDFTSGRIAYAKIIHPEDLARVGEEVARYGASGVPAFEHQDYRIVDPQGRVRWVRDNTAVVRNGEGRITHYFGYILDNSARHEALEAIEHAKRQAEDAARAKSDFLANVSHELRTPLTLIIGPLEALIAGESGPFTQEAMRSLERVRRNADRLFNLVSDLLDFAKVEAGRETVYWEPVDTAALVGGLVDDARAAAKTRGLSLSYAVEGAPGPIPADRLKMELIALNLLSNALKFTPAGGRIDVTVRPVGDFVEVAVADTGPGIPADELHRIFQRFEQIDASTTRRHEGTGIGLALVKAYAELMGGTVSVESQPGRGSRFAVRLARRADQLAPLMNADWRERSMERAAISRRRILDTAPKPTGIAARAEGKPRVIVADDNADMCAFMAEVLREAYDVETVANGAQALEAVRRRAPEVVVCDIMMPEIDGLEVVRRLKADPQFRAIPVVLVTAKAGREEAVSGIEAGADDYLPKPFEAAELRARVHAAERLHRVYLDAMREHRELEQALEKLKAAQEQLIQAGKLAAVGTLTAGISHELNNPIATALLNTQKLLREAKDGSPEQTRLAAVERQMIRCRDLIQTLLNLTRRKPPVKERIPVASVIAELGTIARSQARGRSIDVECPPTTPDLPDIEGSRQEIEAALLDLISNAIDATQPGGRVSLTARRVDREGRSGVEIAVADTGHGIPADVMPHLFDPFFTTKPPGKGTGLGLAMAQRLVRNNDGHIEVETAAGRGTTMRVWLPSSGEPLRGSR